MKSIASILLNAKGTSSTAFKNFSARPSLVGESSLCSLNLRSSSLLGAILNKLSSNSVPSVSVVPVERCIELAASSVHKYILESGYLSELCSIKQANPSVVYFYHYELIQSFSGIRKRGLANVLDNEFTTEIILFRASLMGPIYRSISIGLPKKTTENYVLTEGGNEKIYLLKVLHTLLLQ